MLSENTKKTALGIVVVLQLIVILALGYNLLSLRMFVCDVQNAFIAERQYTWNVIRRNTGEDPAEEAKAIDNPVLTGQKYSHCHR